jgi:hypothetical protein
VIILDSDSPNELHSDYKGLDTNQNDSQKELETKKNEKIISLSSPIDLNAVNINNEQQHIVHHNSNETQQETTFHNPKQTILIDLSNETEDNNNNSNNIKNEQKEQNKNINNNHKLKRPQQSKQLKQHKSTKQTNEKSNERHRRKTFLPQLRISTNPPFKVSLYCHHFFFHSISHPFSFQ